MSVTFSIEANPTGAFEITCYDPEQGQIVVGTSDSYEGILVERAAHMLVCDECRAYGCYSRAVFDVSDDLDVNVSNTNARMLMGILGIDGGEELCGVVDGQEFLGAVMLAMAADRDDTGVAPAQVSGTTSDGTVLTKGATMIDCGLRPGYFGDRFGGLHALASEAVRLGRSVQFS